MDDGDTAHSSQPSLPTPVLERFRTTFLRPLVSHGKEFALYQQMVESLVVDVADLANPRVLPTYSPELTALEEQRKGVKAEVMALYESALRGWGSELGLKLMEDKSKGFQFRAHKSCDKAVRDAPGVSPGDISVLKDGIYFTPTKLGRLSERMLDLDGEYRAAQKAVVDQAVGVAKTYTPVLEGAAALVAELDAYKGMGHVVACGAGEYVKPTILAPPEGDGAGVGGGGRRVVVKEGRHPVMELQDDVSFIPNDYYMDSQGEDVGFEGGGEEGASPAGVKKAKVGEEGVAAHHTTPPPGGRFHIITGPNMGGKSTYIRTLGVLVVMAQVSVCGSYSYILLPKTPTCLT